MRQRNILLTNTDNLYQFGSIKLSNHSSVHVPYLVFQRQFHWL